MKRGFLSKEEKEYIESNRNLDISELAKDLDRSTSSIEKYIESNLDTKKTSPSMTPFEKVVAKKSGATIMTNGGSEMIDGGMKKKKRLPSSLNGCIHKIK